jgi:ATP-dependent Lhr-like helicase
MESDDLMAAVFPDAAACQENVTGPITIPDHPLVRQTIHDTLTESLDVDGLIELWEALEAGTVTMSCVEVTEPSPLAHEILTARPYAFLDDGELPDRRTQAVRLRRGLPVSPAELGSLLPEAIAEVRAELAPDPRTADELHDLLRDVVLLAARDAWRPLFAELVDRGRAVRLDSGGRERWHAVESATAVEVLLSGVPTGELFSEQVAADVLRGHLAIDSPVTADALEAATGLAPTLLAVGLATLEAEGSAIQGHFTGPPGHGAPVEWCSRRLLARMHSRSRRTRRRAVEPVTSEQFMRFLVRWQHVAPGTQLRSAAGLGRVLEQLQGWEAAVASWEPSLLARRVDGYDPRWLDRLCHDGEIQWLRLSPRLMDDPDRRGGGPSKATPVSIVHRHDLRWLLPAVRGEAAASVPAAGPVAEIAAALSAHGARFLTDLVADTARLATDVEAALWEGVARGLFTADGFEAVRSLTAGPRRSDRDRQPRALSKLRRSGVRTAHAAGRWSLVPAADPDSGLDRDELVEALADQLLQRWGVVFYDLVAIERPAVPWRELQWALRRLEDRGLVKGGRFVKGISGEQFALPEAVEDLGLVRRREHRGQTVQVCGSDPLNLTGTVLPGARTPARRTEVVRLPV